MRMYIYIYIYIYMYIYICIYTYVRIYVYCLCTDMLYLFSSVLGSLQRMLQNHVINCRGDHVLVIGLFMYVQNTHAYVCHNTYNQVNCMRVRAYKNKNVIHILTRMHSRADDGGGARIGVSTGANP
jgi:hypothetical protein